MTRYPTDQRRRDLATIHMVKKQLGMDDAAYRDILWSVARVRSSSELDQAGRSKLLDRRDDERRRADRQPDGKAGRDHRAHPRQAFRITDLPTAARHNTRRST